ncbi:hypothetical protein Ancab_013429 [Ancistrocladus abbreviatus]
MEFKLENAVTDKYLQFFSWTIADAELAAKMLRKNKILRQPSMLMERRSQSSTSTARSEDGGPTEILQSKDSCNSSQVYLLKSELSFLRREFIIIPIGGKAKWRTNSSSRSSATAEALATANLEE